MEEDTAVLEDSYRRYQKVPPRMKSSTEFQVLGSFLAINFRVRLFDIFIVFKNLKFWMRTCFRKTFV